MDTTFAGDDPGPLARRLGFWAAAGLTLAWIVFTLCFVAIPLTTAGPLFVWTTLADYRAYVTTHNQLWPDLARAMMLACGPLLVILLTCLLDLARGPQRLLLRLSLAFGTLFAGLTGMHYFVQLTTVRLGLDAGAGGLEQWAQANPLSGIAAINLLGWALGLGPAALFAAAAFPLGGRPARPVERVIRLALAGTGACCLLGGAGYVLNNPLVVALTLDLGMGGCLLVAVLALCRFFRQAESAPAPSGPRAAARSG